MPPTSATVPSSRYFATYGLRSRMARVDWRTFSSATFVTQPASFESPQCAASTAGCILASRPVRLPSCTPSIAPLTAPQLVCPSTTMTFAPTLTAYSRLPSSSSFTTLPPTRTAKTSPIPWSKTISTGARESMQPSTATKGNWPAAVATTLADQSRRRVAFATKRALPAFSRSSACDGVIAACDARVCTSGFEGAAAGSSAVATRAPSARHKTTAEALRRVEPSRRSGGRPAPLGVRLEGRTGHFPSPGLSPDQFAAGGKAARYGISRIGIEDVGGDDMSRDAANVEAVPESATGMWLTPLAVANDGCLTRPSARRSSPHCRSRSERKAAGRCHDGGSYVRLGRLPTESSTSCGPRRACRRASRTALGLRPQHRRYRVHCTVRLALSALTTRCLREADEQVAQVGGVRRIAQQRRHVQDLLDRAQRRAVGVVDGVLIPPALGLRREHDHADRAVPGDCLVPEDEERAVVGVGLGREDLRYLRRQPGVALLHGIVQRGAGVVHVVAQVRRDEVVARRVVDEVRH